MRNTYEWIYWYWTAKMFICIIYHPPEKEMFFLLSNLGISYKFAEIITISEKECSHNFVWIPNYSQINAFCYVFRISYYYFSLGFVRFCMTIWSQISSNSFERSLNNPSKNMTLFIRHWLINIKQEKYLELNESIK